jgi:inorganic pyrophosphatase
LGENRLLGIKKPWNYGAIPQTWENPNEIDEHTGYPGDSDPLDVVDLSNKKLETGSVVPVKVIGGYALIDEGEIDWKAMVITCEDELFDKLNDLEDVEKYLPGRIAQIHHWYKIYKTYEGKGENKFAFDGNPVNRKMMEKILEETHIQWRKNQNLFI